MDIHIEKEYKLLVDKQHFDALYASFNAPIFKKQINTYFDTLQDDLQSRKIAMRIREKQGNFMFTLKAFKDKDLYEYECEVEDNSIQSLQHPDIQNVLQNLSIVGPFKVIAIIETLRAVVETKDYELCFDESSYDGVKDYEIEYEYKRDHDGYANFTKILKTVGLSYTSNSKSKIQRALESKY